MSLITVSALRFGALLAGTLLLGACEKEEGRLEGPAPQASFTSQATVQDYSVDVAFTNTSQDGFIYQWNFGDDTDLSSAANPTHTYNNGGTYNVKLTVSGRGGTSTATKQVTVAPRYSALDRAKQMLTGNSSRTWVLDNTVAAPIVVGPDDANPTQWYAGGAVGSLPACQADDEFTFSMSDQYTYDAKAQTLVAGNTGCAAPLSGTSAYTFGAATGAGVAQFTLARTDAFIGVTDGANRTYRILSIDNQKMVLRVGPPSGAAVHTMKLRVK
ncbi:PKD domain-containing protein [Hymenobacter edaphi]|uniref:PKD domain-containing protein n=1 Tax=Hymenobacter edaphi TaxID=2211146 RepID=A0A328BRM5_9BACT|nr:PKD domain-containing protein [Hymenobacter edaphi]RAK69345.1 hypothetical protein DLM85_00320 [Hymenobacter edaphi]